MYVILLYGISFTFDLLNTIKTKLLPLIGIWNRYYKRHITSVNEKHFNYSRKLITIKIVYNLPFGLIKTANLKTKI